MKSYFILLLCTFMLVSMVYPLSTYAKTNNSGVATISQKDANMIEQKVS